MNLIQGIRVENELFIMVDGEGVEPKHSQKLFNHSPDGFSAGYGGSGVAQSALGILLHVTKDPDKSVQHHQAFKWEFLANPRYLDNNFEFEVDIKAWIQEQENAQT